MINGEIKYGGRTYKSISKLTADDVKMLAAEAKNNFWLSNQIFWLEALPELIEEYAEATKERYLISIIQSRMMSVRPSVYLSVRPLRSW